MLSEFSLTWTDRLEFDSCTGRCSIDISGCTLLGQNKDVNIYMIKSDKLHRRNLGSSSQPANRNLPLICILLSLIRNIVQCLALLSANMCDTVTVNGHEQPLMCCKLGRKTWEPLVDLIRCDKVTPRHEQAQTNKIYVQADMQNPAACHTIREFSWARFFCIKYNDNCYLPFQESLKSDWIVGHSPNQNYEKHETITFMWKQIHDSAIVPLSQQTSYQDWESMKVPVWDVDISL